MSPYTEQQFLFAGTSPAAQQIASEAWQRVRAHYSETGDPTTDAAAELYLPYHNTAHQLNVAHDIRLLRDIVGLTPYEYEVALNAGFTHDVYQELDAPSGTN